MMIFISAINIITSVYVVLISCKYLLFTLRKIPLYKHKIFLSIVIKSSLKLLRKIVAEMQYACNKI